MPATQLQLAFPHDYDVREITEIVQPEVEKHFYFPGASEHGGRDGLLLGVTPRQGAPWSGTFAFGHYPPTTKTGIYSCPDPQMLCVVAKGEAYFVKTDEPEKWGRVESTPIFDVRPILSKGLLIFSDFTTISAYGVKGRHWRTDRLSWDGIEITNLTAEYILGLAWDSPKQRHVEFCVEVQSGKHHGGSSPK